MLNTSLSVSVLLAVQAVRTSLCLPSPSSTLKYVGATVAPIMAYILLCYYLQTVKEFPFPTVLALRIEAVKKHLVPNLLLRLFLTSFVHCCSLSPLIKVCDLLKRYQGCVSCPPNLDLYTQIPEEIPGRQNTTYLVCESLSLFPGSITDIPIAPGILGTLFRNQRNKGYNVHLVMVIWSVVRVCWG